MSGQRVEGGKEGGRAVFFFFFLEEIATSPLFAASFQTPFILSYLLRQLQCSPRGQRRGRDTEHAGSLRRSVARRSGERAHERERARRSEIRRRQRTRAGRHARGLSSVGFREGLDVGGRGEGRGREQESSRHRAREGLRERERASTEEGESVMGSETLMPSTKKKRLAKSLLREPERQNNVLTLSLAPRYVLSFARLWPLEHLLLLAVDASSREKDRREEKSVHHRR